MRCKAQAKVGYYPTPEPVTAVIAGYLKPKEPGPIRILDPCAGEGSAIQFLGDHLKAQTYGIEIDLERGKAVRAQFSLF